MLRLYYTNIANNKEKRKFLVEVVNKCRVGEGTVRTWLAKPGASAHRNPKPIYWPVLSEITGIKEEKLFKNLL